MRLDCPIQCGTSNEADADRCAGCGSPLRNHTRLSAHAAHLFNQGLVAARTGELSQARELFAAVVHWMPKDRKARNALALASFELGDEERARHHWNQVLAQRPTDSFATTGLNRLNRADPPTDTELPTDAVPPADINPSGESEPPASAENPADDEPSGSDEPSADASPPTDGETATEGEPPADAEPPADTATSADAVPAADAHTPTDVESPDSQELSADTKPRTGGETAAEDESPTDGEPSAGADASSGAAISRPWRKFTSGWSNLFWRRQ